jgi:hypothetical protein
VADHQLDNVQVLPRLTVMQPWAWCIAAGCMTVWSAPRSTRHRGPVALHADTRVDPNPHFPAQASGAHLPLASYSRDTVIAVVDLVDVCEGSRHAARRVCTCGPWARPTTVHWRLAGPRVLREALPVIHVGIYNVALPADVDLAEAG